MFCIRMKHKRLVNAVKCDETVQRRQVRVNKTLQVSNRLFNRIFILQVRQAKRVKKSMSKLEKAGIKYNFQIAEMAAAAAK